MRTTFHLLYSSTATGLISPRMVQDILEISRKNNEQSGITGLLICRAGHFLQLLEGEEGAVQALYKRIQRDRRHCKSVLMAEFHSEGRIFPQWQMGFIEEEKQTESFSKGINAVLNSPVPLTDDMRSRIVEVFRKVSQAG